MAVINELQVMKCCVEDEKNLTAICKERSKVDATLRLLQERDINRLTPIIDNYLSLPENKDFMARRKQNFGMVGRQSMEIDQRSGGANWYSVDRNGNIRMHFWYTMGYGQAWGKQ